jgi:ATP-dependent DNA helicase RecG
VATSKKKLPPAAENQNVEWKESWRDEYLKWICGFANAQGGHLEIGRNDKGVVVGLPNVKKLLEELPNKIRSTMGIVADVNLLIENGHEYITIDVMAHLNVISYRGKYYLRSGSTNQELTGFALDELIFRKYGRTWDSAPVLRVKPNDFYNDAFDIFRKKAVTSDRLKSKDVEISNAAILNALKLTEGDYILKAGVLLFHQDPEQWCYGSYVKIGYFDNDVDLRYQDEINGPLISIADRVLDTIYTKYFKGWIHYEGIQRIDKYPMPDAVLREAVLNAVVHKDYASCNPIHIKIYADKVVIYNNCQIPNDIEPKSLLRGIRSIPHNPLIAGVFFRSGQVEAWGRGIEKMINGCLADGLPAPEFEILPNVFSITFRVRNNDRKEIPDDGDVNGDVNGDVKAFKTKIIELILEDSHISILQIADILKTTKRRVERQINLLKEEGNIERIGADKNGHWVVKNTSGSE